MAMQRLNTILTDFNPLEDKYISREFQKFGYYMSEQLGDYKHKSLYIRLAKDLSRAVLERALSFCKDASARNKGALFMWKLKEMGAWTGKKTKKKSSAQSA